MGKQIDFLPYVGKDFGGKPPKSSRRKKNWEGKIIKVIKRKDFGEKKYYNTVELIRDTNGDRYVRFGYYIWGHRGKKKKGAYYIAGQTTFMAKPELAWSLMREAKRKGFFK